MLWVRFQQTAVDVLNPDASLNLLQVTALYAEVLAFCIRAHILMHFNTRKVVLMEIKAITLDAITKLSSRPRMNITMEYVNIDC